MGLLAVCLRAVHVRPRGAVQDGVGLHALDRVADGGRLGDVELAARKAHDLVSRPRTGAENIQAEHPGRPCQKHPQMIEMLELSPTMRRYARGCR